MNRGAKALYDKYAFRSKHDKASFEQGAIALKAEIEEFIEGQLKGTRGDAFSMGQDDGLRWVNDHLRFLFTEEK
jgi:hypothetical protein